MSNLMPLDTYTILLGNVAATDSFGLNLLLDGVDLLVTAEATAPGIFRTRRRPSDAPVADIGQFQTNGSLIGFLQGGALLMPVLMPGDGWLLCAAPEGARVEYGSPLFRILRATEAITP